MNIYEKLQSMRYSIQSMQLKKSGKNKFAGYDYFELQDIIPAINKLMFEHKVSSELVYGDYNELAVLKIINAEKPNEIMMFSCPVKSASLKGCHEVQNLGATITYIRRYLYVNAFEIVEHDALDRMPLDANTNNKSMLIDNTTREKLGGLVKSMDYDPAIITEYLQKVYGFANSTKITTDKVQEIMNCITAGKVESEIVKADEENK